MKNPPLKIASQLWEYDRQLAFLACYKPMRRIDDLVDSEDLSKETKTDLVRYVSNIKDIVSNEIDHIISRFRIPLRPWINFSKAMIYDLTHKGFDTLEDFLKYSEGAAVAPGAIWLHLAGLRGEKGRYVPPEFDIEKKSRPLALFAYFTHILRDFKKDQLEGLNYFARDKLKDHDLKESDLRDIAKGSSVTDAFSGLIREYVEIAESYRQQARAMIDSLNLEKRYQDSVEVIYQLYLQLFDRVDPKTAEIIIQPKRKEIKQRVASVINK